MLTYHRFTAVLLIYGSLFLSGIYYCLRVFCCAAARMSELELEQRTNIKFLVKLGKSGKEIREMIVHIYGDKLPMTFFLFLKIKKYWKEGILITLMTSGVIQQQLWRTIHKTSSKIILKVGIGVDIGSLLPKGIILKATTVVFSNEVYSNLFLFGYFPCVWVLIADVSELTVGSIFIGRWMKYVSGRIVWGVYTWLGWSGEMAEPIWSSVPVWAYSTFTAMSSRTLLSNHVFMKFIVQFWVQLYSSIAVPAWFTLVRSLQLCRTGKSKLRLVRSKIWHACKYFCLILPIFFFSNPITGLEWPKVFQEVKVPRLHDNGTGWW